MSEGLYFKVQGLHKKKRIQTLGKLVFRGTDIAEDVWEALTLNPETVALLNSIHNCGDHT